MYQTLFVDTSVKKKIDINTVLVESGNMVGIFFSETRTVCYRQCVMCDSSHTLNMARGLQEV